MCHNFSYELQAALDVYPLGWWWCLLAWRCVKRGEGWWGSNQFLGPALSVWFHSVRVQRWSSGTSSFFLMLGPSDLLELMLNSPLLLPAPWNGRPLLLVQQGFKLRGHPGLVVGETQYPPGWRSVLYTEVDMVCGAVCQAVYVISMTAAECLLVCGLERVPQSLACLIGPHFHRLLCRQTSHPGCVFIEQMYEVVIRTSKSRQGGRGVCVFDISI